MTRHGKGLGRFPPGTLEAQARDERRELIDRCRRKAVREMREGREWTIVSLPDGYTDYASTYDFNEPKEEPA